MKQLFIISFAIAAFMLPSKAADPAKITIHADKAGAKINK